MGVMRWVWLVIVAALVALAFVAYTQPQVFPVDFDLTRVIYLVLVLILVAGAGVGFRRLRADPRNLLWSALAWVAVVLAIVGLYQILN